MNEQYVVNSLWLEKLKKSIRSFYKTIYLGSPLYILLNIMFCLSIRGLETNFWVIFIPMCIMSTAFCIYFPLRAIKRYKNIVQVLVVENEGKITLTLIDGRVIILPQYEIKDVLFNIGRNEKLSKSITDNSDGPGYIIIPEFFTQLPILWQSFDGGHAPHVS
jgi:hypothetical protein